MRTVGIFTALHKPEAVQATRLLHDELVKRDRQVLLTHDVAETMNLPAAGHVPAEVAAADLAIIAGGDGSVLAAARLACLTDTPLLPIDLGTFGFLSECQLDAVAAQLDGILEGRFHVQHRAMLRASVLRSGTEINASVALNDAVISKGAFSRLMRFRTFVDDEYTGNYPADGMIVATPTGSTAYALSAGGPVAHPTVDIFLLVPICAHTLFTRPLILAGDSVVRIEPEIIDARAGALILTLDGQEGIHLEADDVIEVRRAPNFARFVRFDPNGFYSRLRTKLKWGGGL